MADSDLIFWRQRIVWWNNCWKETYIEESRTYFCLNLQSCCLYSCSLDCPSRYQAWKCFSQSSQIKTAFKLRRRVWIWDKINWLGIRLNLTQINDAKMWYTLILCSISAVRIIWLWVRLVEFRSSFICDVDW